MKKSWSGIWVGTGYSYFNKTEYELTARLEQRGKTIKGVLTTQSPETLEYNIIGQIEEPGFMTYSAKNVDDEANYIVGINRLASDDEDKMTGEYVARSRFTDKIITGRINLAKQC